MPIVVVCLVPAAPVLLPRLTGTRVPEVQPVRDAVDEVLAALSGVDRVVVVTEHVPGTLAGFGSPTAAAEQAPGGNADDQPSWPRELADELLDGRVDAPHDRPDGGVATAQVREHRTWAEMGPDEVEELEALPGRVGLLLLADGSRTRGPRAPGGQDPRGDAVDAELVAALRQGRPAVVPDAAAVGATAGAAVALLARAPGGPTLVLHEDAPLGVAYLVAVRHRDDG